MPSAIAVVVLLAKCGQLFMGCVYRHLVHLLCVFSVSL